MNVIMKKEFIRLSGILCLITLIAAFLLAGVNKITEEKIIMAQNQANNEAMRSLLPEADDFKELAKGVNEGVTDGKSVGYCVMVYPKGFADKIELMVGINADHEVTGVEILSHSETPGLGAKATTDAFKNQFKGKDVELSVVKVPTENKNEISAITGATITSRAVADGVKEAAKILESVKGDK